MKIRNLLVLAITIAVTTLCAQAQESDGSMTFKDHLGQSITIGRFGTVLSFKDGKGMDIATDHAFRICPACGNGQCIDSRKAPAEGTSTELKVEFPVQGDTILKNKALIVTSTVRQGALTLTRRVTWPAGSSVVNIDETISVSNAIPAGSWGAIGNGDSVPGTISPPSFIALGTYRESGRAMTVQNKPCPPPPGGVTPGKKVGWICPPEMRGSWAVTAGTIELTKPLLVHSGTSLVGKVGYVVPFRRR